MSSKLLSRVLQDTALFSSAAPEDFYTSHMSGANWIVYIYMTPIRNTKCSLCQLKAFTSPHPRPPLHVLSPLTVCASLPIGNYPSVFLRFITISWPPQDVQTKWGIWICLLVCAREHLCTNTVVTGLTTHAQKKEMQAVQTHTHADNRIIMHKNKHARIHHADIQNTRTLVNTH